jgi:hypothetical protein
MGISGFFCLIILSRNKKDFLTNPLNDQAFDSFLSIAKKNCKEFGLV